MSSVSNNGPKIELNKSGGGGSGGTLVIQDAGVTIGAATTLNFEGSQVAVFAGTLPGQIIIQIPPSLFASYFNQASANIPDSATVIRDVAAPTIEGTPYKIGSWTAGSGHPCTNTGLLTYTTAGFFSIFDLTTTINVTVYDADGITPLATHTETLTGNLDVTTSSIRILITGFTADSTKYKAHFSTLINIGNLIPSGGRFSIKITHADSSDGGPYIKSQNDIFYDPNPLAPTISNPTFSENVPVVTSMSGVRAYGLGSTFNVAVNTINNINNSSYPQPFLTVTGTSLGLATQNVSSAGLTGWTNSFNNINASYVNYNWAIAQTNYFDQGALTVSANWVDWTTGAVQTSLPLPAIVSTYADNSTNIYTDFRTEAGRLLSNFITPWDSTQNITTYDGGTGLQVINSKLVYPTQDFSTYNPTPGSQPNYSLVSGPKTYNTFMSQPSVSNSNGIFQFTGTNITEAMLTAGDVLIKISLDKVNWFSLNADYLGGPLSNGDGCRVDDSTSNLTLNGQLAFTFGPGLFTNAGSNWGMYIQITYAGTVPGMAAYIDSLSSSTW